MEKSNLRGGGVSTLFFLAWILGFIPSCGDNQPAVQSQSDKKAPISVKIKKQESEIKLPNYYTLLESSPGNIGPSFSLDDKLIAFTSYTTALQEGIYSPRNYVINADGSGKIKLPIHSPKIVFGQDKIYSMGGRAISEAQYSDGKLGKPKLITPVGESWSDVNVSCTGKPLTVRYKTEQGEQPDVAGIYLDGKRVAYGIEPDISCNGSQVITYIGDNYQVFTQKLDGGPVQVSNSNARYSSPRWVPDGKYKGNIIAIKNTNFKDIVDNKAEKWNRDLVMIDPATNVETQLTKDGYYKQGLDVSSDGSTIVLDVGGAIATFNLQKYGGSSSYNHKDQSILERDVDALYRQQRVRVGAYNSMMRK